MHAVCFVGSMQFLPFNPSEELMVWGKVGDQIEGGCADELLRPEESTVSFSF